MELRIRCLGCGLLRYPEIEIVKKGRKKWKITTCRVCKYHDIQEHRDEL